MFCNVICNVGRSSNHQIIAALTCSYQVSFPLLGGSSLQGL
ncbi:hypothetical protein EVA_16117 [gut metagenome]|uniref:Uncharacterized protein n=1 Tax=gut metagenome TaxID=749906 RepID=J9FLI7_9ZZZZ